MAREGFMSSLVYMTAKSRAEALELARILAGRKLCAGINIVPGATSVYWWDGEIRENEECLLLAQVSDQALPGKRHAGSHYLPAGQVRGA